MITHSKASKRKDAAAADARTWMGPHTSIYILLAATAGHWLVQKNARYVTFVGAGVLGGPVRPTAPESPSPEWPSPELAYARSRAYSAAAASVASAPAQSILEAKKKIKKTHLIILIIVYMVYKYAAIRPSIRTCPILRARDLASCSTHTADR